MRANIRQAARKANYLSPAWKPGIKYGDMIMYENIKYELNDANGVLTITMNRPKALNALNRDTLSELSDAFAKAAADDAVKAVIITGEGRAFVAGADISQMRDLEVLEGRDMTRQGQALMNQIEALEKPVIAAVNGYALGGGCELSMACDIRIASTKAVFGQPEVNLGIIPGFGGTQRLPRLIGKGNAKYYCMTAENIRAEEALRLGLVSKVVEPEELMGEAVRIAAVILSKAPIAIKCVKLAINNGMDTDLDTGIAYEAEVYTTSFASHDRIEGMTAFTEKRPTKFEGK